MTTYAEIIEFVAEEIGCDHDFRKTWNELGMDSLEVLSFLQEIEEKFGITFDRAMTFKSPQGVISWIREDHLRRESRTSTTSAH